MNVLSNVIGSFIGLVFIGVFVGLPIYNDYTWDDAVISQKENEGWKVVEKVGNVIDLTAPWTFFKQPIYRLAFVKESEITTSTDGILFTKVLWVDRDMSKSTKKESTLTAFDCKKGRSAQVDVDQKNSDQAEILVWQTYKVGLPGENIISFVCTHEKSL